VDAIFTSPVDSDRIATLGRVGRGFYQRPTADVARDLLGKLLVHRSPRGVVVVRLAETEAYLGPADRAAHTWGGRRTPRVRSMWGRPGLAYVYLIYGLHHCLNLVTSSEGGGEAVLLRGGAVVAGLEIARARRGEGVRMASLADGPGKLCQAAGITRAHDGVDTVSPGAGLYIVDDGLSPLLVETTRRVGVDSAGEAAAWPLRFVVSS